jgi:hypothetical protein
MEFSLSIETIGLLIGIWLLAGVGFCALWAAWHSVPEQPSGVDRTSSQMTFE